MEKHYTTSQVAEFLGTTIDKVQDLIKSCQLQAINITLKPHARPRWRISESAFQHFKNARSNAPQPPSAPRPRRERAGNYTKYY